MKLLIVEDQKWPLMALEQAIEKVMPRYVPGFARSDYAVVKCYDAAEEHIKTGSYDIVLLDNALPYQDQGELEDRDFDKYCSRLSEVGYTLIPEIKQYNPQAVIIGTSSSSPDELRRVPTPDFSMRKMLGGPAEEDLEKIMAALKGRERGEK